MLWISALAFALATADWASDIAFDLLQIRSILIQDPDIDYDTRVLLQRQKVRAAASLEGFTEIFIVSVLKGSRMYHQD